VPEYLLVGKGYGFSSGDYQFMGDDSAFRSVDASQQGLALSGDYHNCWLSVIITFGIWGIAATLWFFVAGWRALYDNCRYGDPNLKTFNYFLLASFLARILMFMTVSGSGLHSDLLVFVGMLGLSISLNGGIRRPSDVPVQTEAQTLIPARPRLLPFYQP